MPWSPLLSIGPHGAGPQADRRGCRPARPGPTVGSCRRSRPTSATARPEYTTFDEIQRTPWECVRGMDHSFGYNAESTEEDFLGRDELLWSVTDIAAKGGNLLLNVGPRAVDAQIPDEQLERLGWLAGYLAPNGHAVFGTRPWIDAGCHHRRGGPAPVHGAGRRGLRLRGRRRVGGHLGRGPPHRVDHGARRRPGRRSSGRPGRRGCGSPCRPRPTVIRWSSCSGTSTPGAAPERRINRPGAPRPR